MSAKVLASNDAESQMQRKSWKKQKRLTFGELIIQSSEALVLAEETDSESWHQVLCKHS